MDRSSQQDIIQFYTRAEPTAAVVWLHGMGTNGTDMDGLTTSLSRARQIGLHHVAPSAPMRRVGDRLVRAWFDLPEDGAGNIVDTTGLRESTALVHAVLDELARNGRSPQRTVLGGFSQGAVQALHAGLRYPKPLAGLVVLAGELLELEALPPHPTASETPILVIHGSHDEVIAPELARQGMERLRVRGHRVNMHELPMGHELTPEVMTRVDEWIAERLAQA